MVLTTPSSRMPARWVVSISCRDRVSMATLSMPLLASRGDNIRAARRAPTIPTRVLVVVVIGDSSSWARPSGLHRVYCADSHQAYVLPRRGKWVGGRRAVG